MDQREYALQTRDDSSEGKRNKSTNQNPEPNIGNLGRFEIEEVIGSGAFGIVYKAYDPALRRTVAIKIPRFGSDDVSKTKRFLTEAHAAANLKHPNIVAVYESGEDNGRPYIVSEYVDGTSLSELIKSSDVSFKKAASIIKSLADALDYAHRTGVVHRDIKSENIMIAENNRPQIMDFGLAKLTDNDSQLTGEGNILGTPAYMAPEQARGEVNLVGPASDQYSLGVILFELLTGQRPYSGPPHSIIAKVGSDEESPESVSLNNEIPRDLSAICHRTMEKNPENRYSSCQKLSEDLSRWLSGSETIARPLTLFEKSRRWYRKNRTLARLWLTVAGLIVVVLTFVMLGNNPSKEPHASQPDNNLITKTEQLKPTEEKNTEPEKQNIQPEEKPTATETVKTAAKLTKITPTLKKVNKPLTEPKKTSVENSPVEKNSPSKVPVIKKAIENKEEDRSATTEVTLTGISELNSRENQLFPWLTADGLQIYWEDNYTDIYTAVRKDENSPFENFQFVIKGRHPTLTEDGQEIVFLSDGKLHSATRSDKNQNFENPILIEEVKNIPAAKNPFISPDGLKLFFNVRDSNKSVIVVSVRSSRNSGWSKPEIVPVNLDGIDGSLTWVNISKDEKRLLCSNESQRGVKEGKGSLMVWTRNNTNEPFSNYKFIQIPKLEPLVGKSPRYVDKTNELYFTRLLGDNPKGGKIWETWVVKNIDLNSLDQK